MAGCTWEVYGEALLGGVPQLGAPLSSWYSSLTGQGLL